MRELPGAPSAAGAAIPRAEQRARARGPARLEGRYRVLWDGRQAVVALPEHIDVSNAGKIREELLLVINRGAAALIADMTATISCDHAGADALTRAYQRAVAAGTQLRLVVTAPVVSRVLSLNGLDRLIPVYPSMEAAAAASVPAAVLARPAGAPDGNVAGITPAVLRELLDIVPDGVMLTDGDGVIILANRRLAKMFGYDHAELPGRPVSSLIPAGLPAARGGHRAAHARVPKIRPACTTGRPTTAGLRKDGTIFLAEVSLRPVTTAAGHFTLAVIRGQAGRAGQPAGPAGLTPAEAKGLCCGGELPGSITASLFRIGLSLRAAIDLPPDLARQHITEALTHLDDAIRDIRDSTIPATGHGTAPGIAPPGAPW
jgi:anti-anti-sigma factor